MGLRGSHHGAEILKCLGQRVVEGTVGASPRSSPALVLGPQMPSRNAPPAAGKTVSHSSVDPGRRRSKTWIPDCRDRSPAPCSRPGPRTWRDAPQVDVLPTPPLKLATATILAGNAARVCTAGIPWPSNPSCTEMGPEPLHLVQGKPLSPASSVSLTPLRQMRDSGSQHTAEMGGRDRNEIFGDLPGGKGPQPPRAPVSSRPAAGQIVTPPTNRPSADGVQSLSGANRHRSGNSL